jgi:Polyketide cyclase / dehydrase and lipid transport
MTGQTCQPVSVSRTINAPADRLFALLVDTANHPIIDGSGMVQEPLPGVVVSGVGDVFSMGMFRDDMGKYEMCNHVVEYEEGRRLVWEPVPAAGAGAEDASEMVESAHYLWGFELAPLSADGTVVTETFDCTGSPAWLQEATKGGEGWIEAMTTTLQKLDSLAVG